MRRTGLMCVWQSQTNSCNAAAIDRLFDDPKALKGLLYLCLKHLGVGATAQDAEDALYDFYSKHHRKVALSYRRGPQSPVAYFKFCLTRFCWKKGDDLRKAWRVEKPLDTALGDGHRRLEIEDQHPDSNPLERMLREVDEQKLKKDISRLHAEIELLTRDEQEILHLRYEEGLSLKEVAVRLDIGYSAAKVRIHRLKERLKVSLERKE